MCAELGRRLPGARLRLFAPLGGERAMVMNAGWPIEPLGAHEPGRLAELAAALDLVVVGGGELVHTLDWVLAVAYGLPADALAARRPTAFFLDGLGPDLERTCPVVWSGLGVPFELGPEEAARARAALAGRPYVSVRDAGSRERLRRAGVTREVAVVPDCALLLPRLFSSAGLSAALDALRGAGRYPREGAPVVVHGHAGMLPVVEQVARAVESVREGRPVVLLSVFPAAGDCRFAAALAPLLRGEVRLMPDLAAPEQVAAAVAGAGAVVATSLHVSITAVAYGRPLLVVNLDERAKVDGFAESVGLEACVARTPEEVAGRIGPALARSAPAGALAEAHARLDAHFDRIAALAAGLSREPARSSP